MLEFRLLGPLEVRDGEDVIEIRRLKQRALVAALALRAGELATTDRLVDDLWGERAPKTAKHGLENYVSELRKALGRDVIATRANGYVARGRSGSGRRPALRAARLRGAPRRSRRTRRDASRGARPRPRRTARRPRLRAVRESLRRRDFGSSSSVLARSSPTPSSSSDVTRTSSPSSSPSSPPIPTASAFVPS